MYELKVAVGKVMGTCTADPPMKRGDSFTVRDGDLTIPEGGYICLWALQSLLPLITPKERESREAPEDDWMWRVHHAQCPDPNGRVVFKIEQTARLGVRALEKDGARPVRSVPAPDARASAGGPAPASGNGHVRDLRVVVEQVKGHCTSQMKPGDCFVLRGGRLYIPHGQHFCLYALHAALPLLPAKQRSSHAGDWLAEDHHVICPDPAGNVVMRIETDKGQ